MSYRTTQIDNNIIRIIDELIKDKRIMFRSRSEFIHDALRKEIISSFAMFPDLKDKINAEAIED